MTRKFCAVYGCLNTNSTHPDFSFFSLPKDDHRRAVWLQLISREELQDKNAHSYLVCEEHFDPLRIQQTKDRKTLLKYTVPSLNLPKKQFLVQETQTEIKEHLNKFVQTDFFIPKMTSSAQTAAYLAMSLPCYKKLKEELVTCKKRMRAAEAKNLTKDSFHKLCDKFLTKPLAEIVKAQTKLKFHGMGNRYPPKYKQFCINLFYTSPQAYKLLEHAMCLPNPNTLAKCSLPISTEVNEHLLTTLKAKVNNMSNSERVCSVVVDAISLKTSLHYNIGLDKIIGFQEVNGVQSPLLTKYALVIMIRSIFGNWKQPIGFALLADQRNSDNMSLWIEPLLEKLIDVGLDIRTFVSDLGLDLLNFEKNCTIDKPYFFIKNRKIYYIIDALHLMKSLRNNFLSCDFHFQGSVAKYEHVLQFYEGEKNKSLRLAPKVTESHIKPTNFEKVEVHYATELLSHTVATAISCYIDFRAIHESAKETVKFIKLINDLFDILNSSTVHATCEYQQAFCGSVAQIAFMREVLIFFKSLKLINSTTGRDVTSSAKFIQGFQITITSILLLYDDLRLEGHNYLLTRRLNQDVIDTFFGQLRSKKKKPTTRQFMTAFKKIFFANIIKPGKQGNLSDLSQLLVNTERLGFMLNSETTEDLASVEDCLDTTLEPNTPFISSNVYNKIELPETNALRYIAGYVLNKSYEVHGCCQLFKSYVYPDDKNRIVPMNIDETKVDANGSPMITPDCFITFVEEMEKHYQNFFNNAHIRSRIVKSIVEDMSLIAYAPPCSCFPILYVKKLFTRIRIYITIKHNNEVFQKTRPGKKCFNVINF